MLKKLTNSEKLCFTNMVTQYSKFSCITHCHGNEFSQEKDNDILLKIIN